MSSFSIFLSQPSDRFSMRNDVSIYDFMILTRRDKGLVGKWFTRLGKPENQVVNGTNMKICLLWRSLMQGRMENDILRAFSGFSEGTWTTEYRKKNKLSGVARLHWTFIIIILTWHERPVVPCIELCWWISVKSSTLQDLLCIFGNCFDKSASF